jgi:cytochrome c biogenesis protein CcmG/thiol:disulfide interchange protein DsbE
MKKITLLFGLLICIITATTAQTEDRKIPAADVKTLDGKTINTTTLSNDGKPMFISFWATWCSPCKAELNAIAEDYDEWKKETGVRVIAVSIDDSRNMSKVAPYVSGKNWDFQVLLDPNGDFKRVMNVNNVPHSFIVNGKGEIVWQQNSSAPGDEDKIFELIKKVAKGEEIK